MSIFTSLKQVAKDLMIKRPLKLQKPIVLQFPVNDICNSKCQMCRIWENKKSTEITPAQLRLGLQNSLFSEVASVGVNGGEPTLRKDLVELVEVLFDQLPKLKTISLITNAYNTKEVIHRITQVGELVRRRGGCLDLMISLDGYGELHDRVRGKPGNFEHAYHVLQFAQASPLVDNLRVGCTIIKENVYGLADLFEFCQQHQVYIKYRIGIPHQRLYTQNLVDPYALTPEQRYHVVEFLEGLIQYYETGLIQKFFYRSLVDQIAHHAPRRAGCDWQHRGATITSKGELLFCAVQSPVLGSICSGHAERDYFTHEQALEEIVAHECNKCLHDYGGIMPRQELIKAILMRGRSYAQRTPLLGRWIIKGPVSRWLARQRYAKRLASLRTIPAAVEPSPSISEGSKVLVCGWYGTETLGDKAILGGVLQALRQAFDKPEIVLVTLFPYVTKITQRQMPELKDVALVTPERGIGLAGCMDLVVFGGGPLMAGIEQLAEMEAIFSKANDYDVATAIAACGVGPLGAPWHNASIGRILQQASLRMYRDQRSKENAALLGVNVDEDLVVEDPAFSWISSQHRLIDTNLAKQKQVLLLGLRDFPYAQYAAELGWDRGQELRDRFEKELLESLSTLLQRHPHLQLLPMPMCTNHFGGDDRWFYRRLLRGKPLLQARTDFSLLGPELSPHQYLSAFQQADAALTMRFHSLVFALGVELPSVAIDYTLGNGKVTSLADISNTPCCNLASIDADFIVAELEAVLANCDGARPVMGEPTFVSVFSEKVKSLMSKSPRDEL